MTYSKQCGKCGGIFTFGEEQIEPLSRTEQLICAKENLDFVNMVKITCSLCGTPSLTPRADLKTIDDSSHSLEPHDLSETVAAQEPATTKTSGNRTKVLGYMALKEYVWPGYCACCLGAVDCDLKLTTEIDPHLFKTGVALVQGKNLEVGMDPAKTKCFVTVKIPFCRSCRKHDRLSSISAFGFGCAITAVCLPIIGCILALLGKSSWYDVLRFGGIVGVLIVVSYLFGFFSHKIARKKMKSTCFDRSGKSILPGMPVMWELNKMGVGTIEFYQPQYGVAFAQANDLKYLTRNPQ